MEHKIFKPIKMEFTKILKSHIPILIDFQNFIIHLESIHQ